MVTFRAFLVSNVKIHFGKVRAWVKDNNTTQGLSTGFIVVNPDCHLIGVVTRTIIFDKLNDDNTSVLDVLKEDSPYCSIEDTLNTLVDKMDKHGVDIIPIVGHNAVIGSVSHREIFAAYGQRRQEDKINTPPISLKYKSARLIVRGRQIYKNISD